MANFKPTIVTKAGLKLLSTMDGLTKITFTRVAVSSATYSIFTDEQLRNTTSLNNIHGYGDVSDITITDASTVSIRASITNKGLESGYHIKTIGLYAATPEGGEVLYSISCAMIADWMPPDDGLQSSSIQINIVTKLANADQVNVTIPSGVYITSGQFKELEEANQQAHEQLEEYYSELADKVIDIQGYIGYHDSDIVGVEVDIDNSIVTRLAGAKELEPGADFDDFWMYGGRRRCNVADDGTVTAYEGDSNYAVDGSNGQVMVEQPKFYYKMIPLNAHKVEGQDGVSCSKFRLYLSATPKLGFKIHPSFTRGEPAQIKDKIYLSAYEACVYHTESGVYNLEGGSAYSEDDDKLSSISGAIPATGINRAMCRTLANNRGTGFKQADILSISCTQMLFLVEYATGNSQSAIGKGVTNSLIATGRCDALQNGSGSVTVESGGAAVTYRGEENLWGNAACWQDNVVFLGDGSGGLWVYYTLGNGHDTLQDSDINIGFEPCNTGTGLISAIGWSEHSDFSFIPTQALGNTKKPLHDTWAILSTFGGWLDCTVGSHSDRVVSDSVANSYGLFNLNANIVSGKSKPNAGARLLFIPEGGIPVDPQYA